MYILVSFDDKQRSVNFSANLNTHSGGAGANVEGQEQIEGEQSSPSFEIAGIDIKCLLAETGYEISRRFIADQ